MRLKCPNNERHTVFTDVVNRNVLVYVNQSGEPISDIEQYSMEFVGDGGPKCNVCNAQAESLLDNEEALWRIWDTLQMWRDDDHQWSADEIEDVASIMMGWTGHRHKLPPQEYRKHDPEDYEDTIEPAEVD